MQPFLLTPAFKDYLWGGEQLKTQYGKKTEMAPLAESWELSAHPDGSSLVASGPFKDMSFAQFVAAHPEAVSENFAAGEEFPILIKLIDAKQALSIQVHPDDAYAARVEASKGKTEMWIVLKAQPGAFLYFGFEGTPSPSEVRNRIADGSITDILHEAPVQAGDVFFIPAGTIHAIGAGILLAEVQQNSNVTYRVFDFGRRGADGKTRPLHVDKALEVTNLAPASPAAPGAASLESADDYTLARLARCPYFTVDRLDLQGRYTATLTPHSFVSLLCLSGSATLESGGTTLAAGLGQSIFVPAGEGSFTLEGTGSFLLTSME